MLDSLFSQGWLATAIAVVIAAVFIFSLMRLRANSAGHVSGIQKKSRLFSTSERNFFESLSDALDYDFHIFAKVGILEIVERGPQMSRTRFKRLSRALENERFDYVVCKKSDLSVSAVIELECFDRRISRTRKQKRDSLISGLCKVSNLRLFYFDTRQDYLGVDIRRLITGSSKCVKNVEKKKRESHSSMEMSELSASQSMVTEHVGQKTCPDCHSQLITKVAVKGKHIGERFLMCRKYPYCDYRVPLNKPNVVNICSAGAQTSELKKGFSDWKG